MGFSDNDSKFGGYNFGGCDPDAWSKNDSDEDSYEILFGKDSHNDGSFMYSNNGNCHYVIGQKITEFAPMNYELKFSFNEKSMDIIVGLAPSLSNYFNGSWLNVSLFIYQCIPTIIVTTGYFQVSGSIIIKNVDNINIDEWLNCADDFVNLVLVDDHESYEVKEIRRIQLPMMKTIRKILKEQISRSEGEINNTLEILDKGFQTPWMIEYTDEECKYVQEHANAAQKGTYIINKPKEKKPHFYF